MPVKLKEEDRKKGTKARDDGNTVNRDWFSTKCPDAYDTNIATNLSFDFYFCCSELFFNIEGKIYMNHTP